MTSRYANSVNTSAKVLTTILSNKEYAQYDLPKAIDKDYRTVLRHLRLLEQYELIRLIREEPARKGGKEKKIFGLTAKGLLQALKFDFEHDENIFERIDQIAEAYPDLLPLIFGKWKLFRKYRVRELIFERFAISLLSLPNRLSEMSQKTISTIQKAPKQPSKGERLPYGYRSLHKSIVRAFWDRIRVEEMTDIDIMNHNVFLEPTGSETSNMQSELFSVLKKDKDLEAYVDKDFERIERMCLGYLQNIESWKKDWISAR